MGSSDQDASKTAFHTLSAQDVLDTLRVDLDCGLNEAEVRSRRRLYGENKLAEEESVHPALLLLRQFTNLMIVVLLTAAGFAGLIGEAVDAIVILVIVFLNGIIGFVQEYRAERALQALQRLSASHVVVLRDGMKIRVEEIDLVLGDIVELEAGNVVPADLRLIASSNVALDEASLTGESLPVEKDPDVRLPKETPAADRTNIAHKGTFVTSGSATCVVVATGEETEIGRIARLIRAGERPMTPLQKRLAIFGQRLSAAILVICAIVFAAGLFRGEDPMIMFLTAISLAVAAIPEALPAVVTIALALGAKRLARHQALVRRLPAVETLGSVTWICCDKTGTLTQNAMRAERLYVSGNALERLPTYEAADAPTRALGRAMALNNDSSLDADGRIQGDPTEVALFDAARTASFTEIYNADTWPRLAEVPFDARRRRMTTIHAAPERAIIICKGAPEAILPLCHDRLGAAGPEPLDRTDLEEVVEAAARSGYRLLAYAEKQTDSPPPPASAEGLEQGLTFLGLVALADPPRHRVEESLASCATAGISVAMITGDHPVTANAIAQKLGIADSAEHTLTGTDLHEMSETDLARAVRETSVYARIGPEQKFNIVMSLQKSGEFVAMTGDGVNDAPALKQADIGVAMGQKGTDVARKAADAVLLDDNFATVVSAVREGRRIYDNIRKFIKYTMTSNSGEIWTIFLAPFLGLPLPLLPIQILWINLVTDGLPGLALSVEAEERNIMARPPRPPRESVFAQGMWQHILWVGLLIAGLSLGAQAWAYYHGSENWQTMVFTVLTLSQLVHAIAIRSDRDSILTIGWSSNPSLLLAVLITFAAQMVVVYLPVLQPIFKTSGLTAEELGVALVLPLAVLVAVEIEKWLVRKGVIYRGHTHGTRGATFELVEEEPSTHDRA